MSFLSVCNFNLVCGKLKYMSFKKQFFVKNAANTLPHINLKTFQIQNNCRFCRFTNVPYLP